MRVSVELPDPPRIEPLLQSLNEQYTEVMRRLLQLHSDAQREDRYAPILQAMQAQQDGLVQAFERMMGVMQQGKQDDRQHLQQVLAPQQEHGAALLVAVRGMKRSLSGLPDELSASMDKQFKIRQQHLQMTAQKTPASTAPRRESAASVVKALGRLESAVVTGLKKSRNRTFGSNY